jgi:hypothetical protein
MDFFSRELRKINLTLRPSASAIYLPTGDPPSTMLPDITDRHSGGLICCGTPIGTDDYVKEQMTHIIDKYLTFT